MSDIEQGLDQTVADLMEQYGVPGVAVGIWHNGQETVAGYGVTNVDHPLPVDADTLFQIGSTSKTFTATLAMMLVEEGKLDLDAPIRRYLPNFQMQAAEVTNNATLRHCFTHTGGWVGDYFDDTGDGDDAVTRYVEQMAELPQLTPLGQVFSYNNAGFALAGLVLETVTNKPYEQLAQERIFAPLGMDRSFFFPKDLITYRLAVGHNVLPEKGATVVRPWALARCAHPVGGITSTVRDQLRYARLHLAEGRTADGKQLLSAQAVHQMQEPRAKAGSMADSVGVSWMLGQVGGAKTVAHGGATNGQLSAFLMVPAHNFAITVLTNANRGRELHRDLVNWSLEHHLGLSQPALTIQSRSPADLAPYAGKYKARLSHLDVTATGDGLQIQAIPQPGFPLKDSPPSPQLPPSTAVFVGEDQLVYVSGPSKGARADILRDEAGKIVWLRTGGRIHRRQA